MGKNEHCALLFCTAYIADRAIVHKSRLGFISIESYLPWFIISIFSTILIFNIFIGEIGRCLDGIGEIREGKERFVIFVDEQSINGVPMRV